MLNERQPESHVLLGRTLRFSPVPEHCSEQCRALVQAFCVLLAGIERQWTRHRLTAGENSKVFHQHLCPLSRLRPLPRQTEHQSADGGGSSTASDLPRLAWPG